MNAKTIIRRAGAALAVAAMGSVAVAGSAHGRSTPISSSSPTPASTSVTTPTSSAHRSGGGLWSGISSTATTRRR